MDPLMGLVVGWTLVVAFVILLGGTVLSVFGLVKFADKSQQKKLFQVLLVESVASIGGLAFGGARLDVSGVSEHLKTEGNNEAIAGILLDKLGTEGNTAPSITKEDAQNLVERVKVPKGGWTSPFKTQLEEHVKRLGPGIIKPQAAKELRPLLTPMKKG